MQSRTVFMCLHVFTCLFVIEKGLSSGWGSVTTVDCLFLTAWLIYCSSSDKCFYTLHAFGRWFWVINWKMFLTSNAVWAVRVYWMVEHVSPCRDTPCKHCNQRNHQTSTATHKCRYFPSHILPNKLEIRWITSCYFQEEDTWLFFLVWITWRTVFKSPVVVSPE